MLFRHFPTMEGRVECGDELQVAKVLVEDPVETIVVV